VLKLLLDLKQLRELLCVEAIVRFKAVERNCQLLCVEAIVRFKAVERI